MGFVSIVVIDVAKVICKSRVEIFWNPLMNRRVGVIGPRVILSPVDVPFGVVLIASKLQIDSAVPVGNAVSIEEGLLEAGVVVSRDGESRSVVDRAVLEAGPVNVVVQDGVQGAGVAQVSLDIGSELAAVKDLVQSDEADLVCIIGGVPSV